MIAAVNETWRGEFPGITMPTPSKEELWAVKGCRDIILDDFCPEKKYFGWRVVGALGATANKSALAAS